MPVKRRLDWNRCAGAMHGCILHMMLHIHKALYTLTHYTLHMCSTVHSAKHLKYHFVFVSISCFTFHVSKIIHGSSYEISKLCNENGRTGEREIPQMSKETEKYHEIDVFYVFHEICCLPVCNCVRAERVCARIFLQCTMISFCLFCLVPFLYSPFLCFIFSFSLILYWIERSSAWKCGTLLNPLQDLCYYGLLIL